MYEETDCFDANSIVEGPEDGLCQVLQPPPPPPLLMDGGCSVEENNIKLSADGFSYIHHGCLNNNTNNINPLQEEDPSSVVMEMQFQNQQMGLNNNTHLIHDSQNHVLAFTSPDSSSYTPTPDLLNLFHLPRSSLLPNSSISFTNPNQTPPLNFIGDLPMSDTASASSILYDPLFHLNLPPQPPMFRDMFPSLPPHGYSLPGSRGSSLFGGGGGDDHVEGSAGVAGEGGGNFYQDGGDGEPQFDNGVLDFTYMGCMGKGRGNGKMIKHFATERQRRQHIKDKYDDLKNLVPCPTKSDRASVVGDAIKYIKELLRSVDELKILVEKKRCARERKKRQKIGEEEGLHETKPIGDLDQSFNNGSLRSSWLQRKSKDTEVDVRIIDDEVTIKLVQRKKVNCLLFVSKLLDELQLDLHHVAGGHVGDYYSFLFNSKIYEGSSVYASAIANKLIEVVDRHYAATPSTSCYQ